VNINSVKILPKEIINHPFKSLSPKGQIRMCLKWIMCMFPCFFPLTGPGSFGTLPFRLKRLLVCASPWALMWHDEARQNNRSDILEWK
jgi:hypothetical protein